MFNCRSASESTSFTFLSSFSRFVFVAFFQTKVYLFAFASIFVPSMYWTSRLTNLFSTSISTTCVKRSSTTGASRFLRNRLMVLKSGTCMPLSHMKFTSRLSSCSIFRPE